MKGHHPRPSEVEMRSTRHIAKILIPVLRYVAESYGYCVAVHGSLQRDIDLVLAPWRELPCDVESLMEALGKVANSVCRSAEDFFTSDRVGSLKNPEKKPCGRLAYTIHVGPHAYLDISVFPPPPKPPEPGPVAGS